MLVLTGYSPTLGPISKVEYANPIRKTETCMKKNIRTLCEILIFQKLL